MQANRPFILAGPVTTAVLVGCLAIWACGPQTAETETETEAAINTEVTAPPPEGTPRLILMLVIDQFGSAEFERLEPFFTGGLRTVVDNGVSFPEAEHVHARTETGPGHASISTGTHPSRHGVVGNWWVDPGEPEKFWAADDDEHDKSPSQLMTSALGDWLKDRYPTAKVYSASSKARAAVMLGGWEADTAFWFDEEEGVFETSSYYNEPGWFEAFTDQRLAERFFGGVWEPLPLTPEALEQLDIQSVDMRPLRSGFPQVLGGLRPAPVEDFYSHLRASPWIDIHLAELARQILEKEELGIDEIPDLLAISFSAADYVGHRYGPQSREYVDLLLRLDGTVGELLELIDEQVGLDQTVVVLTSDHGVVEVPEIRQRRGEPGQRVDWRDLLCVHQVGRTLAEQHGVERWLLSGPVLALGLSERTGLTTEELEAVTARRLEECPRVEKVWTRSELSTPGTDSNDPELEQERVLFANSYYPERSPDFMIRYQEYLMRSRTVLTSHGTSYLYDRCVPALFMIPGVGAGRWDDHIATVDIAPTLAALLDVSTPDDLDGRDLTPMIMSGESAQADASTPN